LINTLFDSVGTEHLEIKSNAMDFSSFAVLYRNYRLFQHYAEAEEDTLTEAEFNKLLEDMEFDEDVKNLIDETVVIEFKQSSDNSNSS